MVCAVQRLPIGSSGRKWSQLTRISIYLSPQTLQPYNQFGRLVVHWTIHPYGDTYTHINRYRYCKLLNFIHYLSLVLKELAYKSACIAYFAAHLLNSQSKHVLLQYHMTIRYVVHCTARPQLTTKILCANFQNKRHEEQTCKNVLPS